MHQLSCRQPLWTIDRVGLATAKILVIAHWNVDSLIGLSTGSMTVWAYFELKRDFLLSNYFVIPKRIYFTLLRLYQCFINWFNSLMMFTFRLYMWVFVGEVSYLMQQVSLQVFDIKVFKEKSSFFPLSFKSSQFKIILCKF